MPHIPGRPSEGHGAPVRTAPARTKKTPANTVRNSTFSTSNRFSGPQSGRTAVSTGGFGQGGGQGSRPALAAAAVARVPQIGPGGAQLPVDRFGRAQGLDSAYNPHDLGGGLSDLVYYPHFDKSTISAEPYRPGEGGGSLQYLNSTGPASSSARTGPPSGRGAVSTGGFGQGVGAAPAYSDEEVHAWLNSAGAQNLLAQNAQASQPSGPPSGRGAVSTGGFGEGYGQIQRPSVPAGPPSGRGAVSTGGFGEGYGGADPYAGLDLTSRANSNARMVLPSADEQRAAIATGGTAYNPAQTARIDQIRDNKYAGLDLTSRANSNARMVLPSADEQRAAIASGGTAYTPEQTARIDQIQDNRVMEWLGTEGAQNLLASNAANAAAAAAPASAWDPANNDAPITGPVGMWTDPNNGGQMPDPADADAWQAMQDAVDKEFGPGQSIYNPEYDTERFSTYDPNNTIAPFARQGVDPYDPTGGLHEDNYGSGPTAPLGTFNPNTGEYLQFGLDLAQNTSDYGRVGEGRDFWNQAQDRKWDEYNRSLPGQYNSRGMIDSGLLNRAEGLAASDRRFETDVRQWSDNEERARLERERMNLYGGFEGGLTQGLVDNYLSGTLTYDAPLTALNEAMGSGAGGYMRSGIMDRAIPAYGPPR